MSQDARFWAKVDRRSDDECWNWTAFKDRDGYGKFRCGRAMEYAHRVAWEKHHRKRLGSKMACHRCDNPSCCNPHHIYAGSAKSNARDASARGRLRSCPPDQHPSRKLTWDKVDAARARMAAGETPYRLASEFGVTPETLRKVRDQITWKRT